MIDAVIEHAVYICQKSEKAVGLIATLPLSGREEVDGGKAES
jgi:hypothetical protein